MKDDRPGSVEKPGERSWEEAVIEELSKVYRDRDEAILLAERAGCPRERMPEFKTSELFWTKLAEHACAGMLHDGIWAFVQEALKTHPANEVFNDAVSNRRSGANRRKASSLRDHGRSADQDHGPRERPSTFGARDASSLLLGVVIGAILMWGWQKNDPSTTDPEDKLDDTGKTTEVSPPAFDIRHKIDDISQCLDSFSALSESAALDETKEDWLRTVERHQNDCKGALNALREI